MKDYLVKALAYNEQVRAYAVNTTGTIGEAQRRHNTWSTASAALGRSMTASVMLGAMLKGEEKITVKINGGGPIGTILVDTNAKGEVRGYVSNPQTHFDLNDQGKLDVKRAVGTDGLMTISKDIGLQHLFMGQIPIVSGEIGEDFTSYLFNSEQTSSAVGVGVLVNPDNTIQTAGGFIIQLMPGAENEVISEIEERLKVIAPISSMIAKGMAPEQILEQILGEGNVKVLEKMTVQFQCQCSEERVANTIISLGSEEIQDMIYTDGQAEAHCHFCNEIYHFTKEDLEELRQAAV
ncbi:Hsp33 family molecular chaperone HslO [Bacillus thuringiensis]|nr:Hsp33 family molecular chaperone HslO [Bacillus thuringiensis]MED2759768.1 Hsp33 family molecular chaperone HslO [Bacillus thuringiensis]MED2769258.1 Hsp33 family molecular chaperone HslO [Bacillus thuringiensis]MED2776649.1 Hsp33 family molecular chaperone HslO [Bacillus thuringiensis]MED2782926.1 Hsp33 family molecular chaperone HslO [Bacillus thuringiensis]